MAWPGKRMSPASVAFELELGPVAGSEREQKLAAFDEPAPALRGGAQFDGPAPALRGGAQVAERSDAEIVAAVLAGVRAAEAQLYDRHARAVAATAVRLLGRSADAE